MAVTHTVTIANFKYTPDPIVITVGDYVQWKNSDIMGHTATRVLSPSFDTGPIVQGATSQPVFFDEISASGHEYFCKPHPFMKGKVIVRAAE